MVCFLSSLHDLIVNSQNVVVVDEIIDRMTDYCLISSTSISPCYNRYLSALNPVDKEQTSQELFSVSCASQIQHGNPLQVKWTAPLGRSSLFGKLLEPNNERREKNDEIVLYRLSLQLKTFTYKKKKEAQRKKVFCRFHCKF